MILMAASADAHATPTAKAYPETMGKSRAHLKSEDGRCAVREACGAVETAGLTSIRGHWPWIG